MDTKQLGDYAQIINRLTETHKVYFPSHDCNEEDWSTWAVLAHLCLGETWEKRSNRLNDGWLTFIGPDYCISEWEMPYISFLMHGEIVAIAVQQDVLMNRRQQLMQREDYQELADGSDGGLVVSDTIRSWDWTIPAVVCVPPGSGRYVIQFNKSNLVYGVYHVEYNANDYTTVRTVARADNEELLHWIASEELNEKYITTYRLQF